MTREEKNAYMREWRKKNREKKKESDRIYRQTHREQIKEYHKKWRDNHREHLNEQARKKYKENPQSYKQRKQKYINAHTEKVKESRHRYNIENRKKRTEYQRNKRQNDPVYRFRTSFRNLIRQYLRKNGYKGGKTTWEIVGCDFETFLNYIQSQFQEGMTLENYGHGIGKWNIDHIIPICTAKTDKDLEKLNHYTNLRPMWASDNYKRPRKIP